jgi:hypothetical protein
MMRQQDWLGPLQVRVSRKIRRGIRRGKLSQALYETEGGLSYFCQGITGKQAQGRGDLIIATTCGVNFCADVSRNLRSATLDGHVDVLVSLSTKEGAGGKLHPNFLQGSKQYIDFVHGQQTRRPQTTHVSHRTSDVMVS